MRKGERWKLNCKEGGDPQGPYGDVEGNLQGHTGPSLKCADVEGMMGTLGANWELTHLSLPAAASTCE